MTRIRDCGNKTTWSWSSATLSDVGTPGSRTPIVLNPLAKSPFRRGEATLADVIVDQADGDLLQGRERAVALSNHHAWNVLLGNRVLC